MLGAAALACFGCLYQNGTPPCHDLSIEAVAVDAAERLYVVGFTRGSTFAPELESKRLGATAARGATAAPAFQPAYVLATSLGGDVDWLRTLETGDGRRANVTAAAATFGTDVVVFGSGAAATRIDATGSTVATIGTERVAQLQPTFPATSPRPPLGATTADGSIVVAIDESSTLARFGPDGQAVWSLSVLPRPSLLVPDLTGGVWIADPRVVHLDRAGMVDVVTATSVTASSGTVVRDASGAELLVVASPAGVTALAPSGTPAWTRADVQANAVVADGSGNLIAIGWANGMVRATWLDAAGAFVASASYAAPELTKTGVAGAAAGAMGGAVIGFGAWSAMSGATTADGTAGTASCAGPTTRLLSARTADHSLGAISVPALTAPEAP